MKLIYTPEGEPRREWAIDPGALMSFQSDWLEECGGDLWETYDEWARLCWSGNRKAHRALLYVMLRGEQPDLRFHHLVIRVKELSVEWERIDLDIERTRQKIEADPDMTPERRAVLLDELDRQEKIDPKDTDGDGPDPDDSATSATGTAST
jgi:hypothetical protein